MEFKKLLTKNMIVVFDEMNQQGKADFMREKGFKLKMDGKISSSTLEQVG
jgi:hypothetical protein